MRELLSVCFYGICTKGSTASIAHYHCIIYAGGCGSVLREHGAAVQLGVDTFSSQKDAVRAPARFEKPTTLMYQFDDALLHPNISDLYLDGANNPTQWSHTGCGLQ